MRVVKPFQIAVLSRPFTFRRRHYLGVASLLHMPLEGEPRLLPESALWQDAAKATAGEVALDAGVPKKRGEFLVAGSAWAPDGNPVGLLRAAVELGGRRRELAVFGNRWFHGEQISDPEPFVEMPLSWQHAFGGEGLAVNPLGKGGEPMVAPDGHKRIPLPNIETPGEFLTRPGQRREPAGFGPVDPGRPQRIRLAGTYDQKWLKTDFPGLARDVKWTYFNIAQPAQWLDGLLEGGERFRLENLHPEKPLIEGELPRLRQRVFCRRRGSSTLEEADSQLSTVWFFPSLDRMTLIYHASFEVEEDDAADIELLYLAAEHAGRERSNKHYADVLSARLNKDGDLASMLDQLRDDDLMPEGLGVSLLEWAADRLKDPRPEPRLDRMRAVSEAHRAAMIAQAEAEDLPIDTGEPPGFPEMPDLSAIDDLQEFIREQEREMKVQMGRLEELQQNRDQHAQKALAVYEENPELAEIAPPPDTGAAKTGPPGYHPDQVSAMHRQMVEDMEAAGQDASDLRATLNDPAELERWKQSRTDLLNLYRQGAHHQTAAPAAQHSVRLRATLTELLERGQSLRDADFTGADLSGMDLRGARLDGILLESACLDGTRLDGAVLDEAVLAHARMEGTCLDEASLVGANLGKVRWMGGSARNADLTDANLVGARLREVDLTGARLEGLGNLLDIRLDRVCLDQAVLNNALFLDRDLTGLSFRECQLDSAVFIRSTLSDCDLSGANLFQAAFISCRLRQTCLSGANLSNARFVVDCDLTGARLDGAAAAGANFRGACLLGSHFDGADLSGADLSEVNAGGASLERIVAAGSLWIRADLRESRLRGADLRDALLTKADLRLASLEGANLFQADLAQVH
ncbi:MAG: DUF2169 domain-containing protein, partial [Wenzhouxiangella sp.]